MTQLNLKNWDRKGGTNENKELGQTKCFTNNVSHRNPFPDIVLEEILKESRKNSAKNAVGKLTWCKKLFLNRKFFSR